MSDANTALRQALAAAILPPGRYSRANPVSKARSNFAVELLMLMAKPPASPPTPDTQSDSNTPKR